MYFKKCGKLLDAGDKFCKMCIRDSVQSATWGRSRHEHSRVERSGEKRLQADREIRESICLLLNNLLY